MNFEIANWIFQLLWNFISLFYHTIRIKKSNHSAYFRILPFQLDYLNDDEKKKNTGRFRFHNNDDVISYRNGIKVKKKIWKTDIDIWSEILEKKLTKEINLFGISKARFSCQKKTESKTEYSSYFKYIFIRIIFR